MAVDPQLLSQIEAAVLVLGSLSKERLLEAFRHDMKAVPYSELADALLKRGRVEAGPPRVGGFRAKKQRGALPDDSTSQSILREGWEDAVVGRLTELLQHKELEELVGDLTYTVRHSRIARGLDDRRGTKAELASALLIQHGIDLLADTEIRRTIAKACGIEAPGRWVPGKGGAVDFVNRANLPSVLAGLPSDETPPSFEYLEGRFSLPPLQDFQDDVRQQLMFGIGTDGHRSILTLPTGAGKTRVAVQAIRDWLFSLWDPDKVRTPGAVVVWLAHTEELCEQASACFRQVWQGSDSVAPLHLVRFWGGHLGDLTQQQSTILRMMENPTVIVSTPQRLVNLLDKADTTASEFLSALRRSLGLIVIDEAHRAAAPSYRQIISSLPLPDATTPIVGLTATPFRMEWRLDPEAGTRELKEIFRNLIEPERTLGANPRQRLQERGVLARLTFDPIETHFALRMPEIDGELPNQDDIERIDRVLATKTAISSKRRLVILEKLVEVARDPRNLVLYFGPTVQDAECMGFLLRERGIPAAVVSGMTRDATRRRLIDRFKRAELRVLCNCEVLTTGFDAPRVTHVVIGRPTVSQVLYEQMIGRGLRGPKFGGTPTCVIMDCIDDFGGPTRPELGYQRFQKIWKSETGQG